MPRYGGNWGQQQDSTGGSGSVVVQTEVFFNRFQLASNASNLYVESYYNVNYQGYDGIKKEALITGASLILQHNGVQIYSNSFDPGGKNTTINPFVSPYNNSTFITGDVINIFGSTMGEANGDFGSASGRSVLNKAYRITVPGNTSFFLRSSSNDTYIMLNNSSGFDINKSPLYIFKNGNLANSNIWIIPSYSDQIDNQANQAYQLQNGTDSGGAITLFPNNQQGSWYVAMDYIGRVGSISTSGYDQVWSNANINNWANATVGNFNLFDINTTDRSNTQNFLHLPAPSLGKMTLVSYSGPDNCGLRSLAFSGRRIDSLAAYSPGTQNTAFDIIGADYQRGAGMVFMCDSSQYYIIGHYTNPGDWWTSRIASNEGQQRNLNGAYYATGLSFVGMNTIINNISQSDYKIYTPTFSSRNSNSALCIIKSGNTGGQRPIYLGYGPQQGISTMFVSSQQYIYQYSFTPNYTCLWLGSKISPSGEKYLMYPINYYNYDNRYYP